jgi:hypothetical protein
VSRTQVRRSSSSRAEPDGRSASSRAEGTTSAAVRAEVRRGRGVAADAVRVDREPEAARDRGVGVRGSASESAAALADVGDCRRDPVRVAGAGFFFTGCSGGHAPRRPRSATSTPGTGSGAGPVLVRASCGREAPGHTADANCSKPTSTRCPAQACRNRDHRRGGWTRRCNSPVTYDSGSRPAGQRAGGRGGVHQ